ncbi:MAG: ATP-binding cassette domain-containing protein [Actinomycetota bacterium]|nr:ATP-binding cassette domain-containing protein [Actinomycetota bacterium]
MTHIPIYVLLSLPQVGAYALFALGIVVTYRASRVLNLAHGAMAMLPAYVVYALAQAGAPVPVLVVAGVVIGALLGMFVERAVLRPLRNQSETTQTVGTVAVLGVVVAVVAKIWGTASLNAPGIFPQGHWPIGNSLLHYGEVGLFGVALLIAGAVALLFRFTGIGLAMRAAAENRRAASLMGIDPDRTTSAAWALAGGLAGISGVLLAAVTSLHPYTLPRQVLPAFVATLLGGLGSIPGALAGAGVVGVATGIIPGLGSFGRQPGSAQVVLALVALVVMAMRGKRHGTAAESSSGGGWTARRARPPLYIWGAVGALVVAWPWLPLPKSLDSIHGDANLAAVYSIIAVSLVVLTGWVGQISLAQASFVGVSAFVTGLLVRGLHIPFPLNLPIAAGVAALSASALGVVALRVRGLYLAVATLIFGWMADAYLFKASWFVGEGGSSTIKNTILGRPGAIPSFDLSDRRIFWYVAAAAATLALVAAANLRDSKTGRALFAVRGSETAAASLGVNVTRMKLFAFGFSGLLAGIAGNLIMVDARTARADQFAFTFSLFYLAIAAVGGLSRLSGAVAASVAFAALSEVFYRVQLNGYLELVSSVLLLAAILLRGAGVQSLIRRVRVRGRRAVPSGTISIHPPAVPTRRAAALGGGSVLAVENVTVQFGGLTAVSQASLDVREGEIAGLIGPNGAGKTTLFNAISGLNSPTRGTVRLFGKDATDLDVHERAALGLGRTFQVLQLISEATVFDNVLIGTHLHSRSGPLAHMFVTDRAVRAEREARERVQWALELVGLQSVADARAGDLPFGMLRLVEIARAVVTDARLILLDEPASGLDERETDRLGDLLLGLRSSLGLALLVVEHDVRFVTRMCDRLTVLDRGHIIAAGDAQTVRSDPAVIAAYLGEAEEQKQPALAGV